MSASPAGSSANVIPTSQSFSNLTLVVVRIDHKPGNDDAYLFINPSLDHEPQLSDAAAKSIGAFDYSFDRIRPFVGGNDAANGRPYAEMKSDEIRIGATYASVTPYTATGATNALVFYSQNFEGPIGSEWSTASTSITPVGKRRFLGEFGNQTIQLSLTNVPAHTLARVTFDFLALRSWDGNSSTVGPDIFQLTNSDGAQLFRTTFNNFYPSTNSAFTADGAAGQSFPGTFTSASTAPVYAAQTGAAEVNSLGYTFILAGTTVPMPQDSVYHLSRVLIHTNGTLLLDFSGSGLQALSDESWGLDNVQVELFNPGPLLGLSVLPFPSLLPGNPVPQREQHHIVDRRVSGLGKMGQLGVERRW